MAIAVLAADRKPAPVLDLAGDGRALKIPTILVVDDDPLMRTLLFKGLQAEGFRVVLAAGGREAVHLYQSRTGPINGVLLDVCMPGLDGPQTLGQLKQMTPDLCCWFMTAGALHYTAEDLLQFGARRVLDKPFSIRDVARVLRCDLDGE